MNEYIEREAAIKAVVEAMDSGRATTSEDLEEVIGDLPAADVAPVRHGRWLLVRPGEWTAAMKCSECGRRISVNPKEVILEKDYPYCHCGAKMDGGEAP